MDSKEIPAMAQQDPYLLRYDLFPSRVSLMFTINTQSVKVDGKPYKSNCYLDWDLFEKGSLIELNLTSSSAVTCGSGKLLKYCPPIERQTCVDAAHPMWSAASHLQAGTCCFPSKLGLLMAAAQEAV